MVAPVEEQLYKLSPLGATIKNNQKTLRSRGLLDWLINARGLSLSDIYPQRGAESAWDGQAEAGVQDVSEKLRLMDLRLSHSQSRVKGRRPDRWGHHLMPLQLCEGRVQIYLMSRFQFARWIQNHDSANMCSVFL